MSIYLKIAETTYKIPNRTIIGRGEPFTVLNEDREIARVHCLLLRKKDGVYVKDLGSESGTYLDGKRLPKKKLVKWEMGQQLRLGKFPLEQLLTVDDSDCIVVSSIKGELPGTVIPVTTIVFSLLFFMYASYIWFGENSYDFGNKVFHTIISAIIFFAIGLFYGLMTKLFIPRNLFTKDIFLSDDGFTAHFDAGGNMTFKFSDIEQWRQDKNKIIIRLKNQGVYNFCNLKNAHKFISFLESRIPKKELKEGMNKNLVHISAAFSLVFGSLYMMEIISLSIVMIALTILGVVLTLLQMKLEGNWATNNRFSSNKKFLLIQVPLILFSLYFFMDPDEDIDFRNQLKCQREEKSKHYCQNIDFSLIERQFIDKKKAEIACEYGNESACKVTSKQRLPASSNKDGDSY